MRVYKEAGEDGLRGYLGTKKEIDFDRINEVLAAFHEGKDTITLRHMGREDGEISSEETDFSGISVLLLEWTHGGSDDLHGVDLPVFLESSRRRPGSGASAETAMRMPQARLSAAW